MRTVYNPVKEEKDGAMARRAIWSTASFDLALDALKKGKRLVANPFYDGNTKLLKADLTFQRTPEEIEEWKRCKNSIIYFVENYCKIMTPKGVQKVKLRKYQHDYLEHLEKHRMSIMLTPRQSGKCFSFLTVLYIRGEIVAALKNITNSYYYNSIYNCYEIPFFEIYNLYDKSLIWKLKYRIYKLIWKLDDEKRANRQNQTQTI